MWVVGWYSERWPFRFLTGKMVHLENFKSVPFYSLGIVQIEGVGWSAKILTSFKFRQWYGTVMCESGFGFESRFKAFLAGFGFRPQKDESGFGFKKDWVDSDSDSNPDSDLCLSVTTLLRIFYCGPNYLTMNQ